MSFYSTFGIFLFVQSSRKCISVCRENKYNEGSDDHATKGCHSECMPRSYIVRVKMKESKKKKSSNTSILSAVEHKGDMIPILEGDFGTFPEGLEKHVALNHIKRYCRFFVPNNLCPPPIEERVSDLTGLSFPHSKVASD